VAAFLVAHTTARTVVDPFCGVGTMLAAANEVGLDAIGVELSRRRAAKARKLVLDGAPYFIAEGIFAQEVVGPCREAGLLADAVCVRNHRAVTFWRRLTRDLRERRKHPLVLVHRGLLLLRSEPRVIAHAAALGCTPMTSEEAYEHVRALVGGPA
jgi:uridine kinase